MKKQTLEVLGVPYLLPAGLIAIAIVISSAISRPSPTPKGNSTEVRGPDRIEVIQEQFLREVGRQAKTFDVIDVRNIRITEGVVARKYIAIDFDYVEKATEKRKEIRLGTQTQYNFELEQDSYGKYSGTLRIAGDVFYVTIY